MSTNRQGIDDAGAIEGADFTPEELAQIEQMQRDNPMPTGNEGGEPPADAPTDPKPDTKKQADAGDGDAELEAGEEEIEVDQPRDQSGRYVSKSALLRVKEQNKKLREQVDSDRAARAKLEGKFELLAEALNAPGVDGKATGKQPENPWDEEPIDQVQDIFGYTAQLERKLQFERKQRESHESSEGQRERLVAMVDTYKADAKRLAAENIKNGEMVTVGEGEGARQIPAFHAAYLHLAGVRDAELEALGIADKGRRDKMVAEMERDIAERSISEGRSPAEAILKLAKAVGFKMPTKGATNGTGKTQKQIDAESHLERVNAGMKTSQSLSGKGGNRPADAYSAQQLMEMSEDQLVDFIAKVGGEEKFAKLYLGAE